MSRVSQRILIVPSGSLTAKNHMNDINDDRLSVYEIGYLITSSIPEEKVPAEAETIKKIIVDAGAKIITEEAPIYQQLSYTMRKKMVSGVYEKYDNAYFGWTKFEVGSDKIESIKHRVEEHPSVLRMLLVNTVKEDTYLGKRVSAIVSTKGLENGVVEDTEPIATPISVEDMDKSIDAMVKES